MPLDTSPLVVLVNPGSGGKQGSKIIERFKKYVPAENIFDLSQGGPTPGLMKYRGSRFRIIACGGDGTVGWIVSEIDKLKLPVELTPPIAILPLGTGNDLSRVLKWGPSYTGKGLKSFMSQVEKACVVMMDKWRVTCETQGHGNDTPASNYIMNNYFSVGADADVALQFHEMRTAHPAKFTSRTQNMLWYARIGVANLSPEPLGDNVKVEVDGCEVVFPENTRAVVVLNLPSYAGGGNPWGSRKKHKKGTFVSPAIDDGLLEVVAISGPVQLVAIHANIGKGKKLAQGRDIKVTITKPMACQVDGEPWRQQASVITIQHGGPSPVLANSKPTVPFAATQSSLNLTREASASPLSSSPSPSPSSNPRVLLRTRSSSSPVENTPSPIKYGPIQPEKRKKGRVYCDECGLEFYLPYMLTNHLASGLCCSSSSSGPAPKKSDSRTTISMKVTDDGASPGVQLEGEEEEKEREERERREGGVWRRHSAEVSYLNNKNNESEYNNGEYIDDEEEEEEEEGEEKDGSSSSPRKHPPSRHNGTIEIAAE